MTISRPKEEAIREFQFIACPSAKGVRMAHETRIEDATGAPGGAQSCPAIMIGWALMKRRAILRGIIFIQIFAAGVMPGITAWGQTSPQTPAAGNPPPDVYLITIDTLRADHVGCYGYKQVETPALDTLAADGIRFTQAFTHSPITNTSHITILTGLLPSVHGVTDFGVPLSPQHVTAAELLKKHGYHTAAFIGAVILDSNTLAPGLDRGFDFYDNFPKSDDKNSNGTNKERWGRVERRGLEVVQDAE